MADAVASLLQLASRYLADRIERLKALTMAGYAIAAIACPFLAFATAPWQILLARFGDRLGKGVRSAPRDRLIADAAPAEVRGRAFGYHRAMDNAGALLGPVGIVLLPASIAFGVIYQHAGARPAFILGAVLALTAILILPPQGVDNGRE